jgi:uroporphyrinogen III methyltransferase/synthase
MTVHLVGAGPGDPGLLTRRGAELLARADVVVYDRLVDPSLLLLAPPGALLVDVGKVPGGAACATPDRQGEINRLLVEHGRAGRTVVRLKGGDPFLFGRGGEEAEALRDAGVDWEVVPGVTSAIAAPAYAGVPVTHRGLSTSVTGGPAPGGAPPAPGGVDWEALGRAGGTLVVLMGMATRGEIARRLLDAGRAATTPVVVVEWGTTGAQRVDRTTLEKLPDVGLGSPAVIVVGAVAGLDLSAGVPGVPGAAGAAGVPGAAGAAGARPLSGRSVVVTRPREAPGTLATALSTAGARVVDLPVVEVAPPVAADAAALAEAAAGLSGYRWVVFTSANAVHRLVPLARDARAFGGVGLAAVGEGTAAALSGYHLAADLVPDGGGRGGGRALADVFPPAGALGERVLFPCAAGARRTVPDGLRAKGWVVDEVVAYRTVPASPPPDRMVAVLERAWAVTFASPSAVDAYLGLRTCGGHRLPVPPVVACIGPTTASAARAAGLTVAVEAPAPSADALVGALVGALGAVTATPGSP